MMYWNSHGTGGWGMAAMMLSNLVFWVLIITAGVVAVRYVARGSGPSGSADVRPTPRQLLGERYARGEIDEDEYRRRLETLHAHG
jgi:putative membrane protein